jgi:hypothetical protein
MAIGRTAACTDAVEREQVPIVSEGTRTGATFGRPGRFLQAIDLITGKIVHEK